MDVGLSDVNEINGVNLDNYFPYQRNCDTVLYVHKRVLRDEAEREEARKAKKKKIKGNNRVNKINERARTESVLEQTVRFAKHLAPIVIPPNDDDVPVFYTVETCSKCKRKEKPIEVQDNTYEKRKCRKIIESYRNDKKLRKQMSTTDSLTHSSQSNTLDDINLNQSLNGTISEQSDKQEKYVKNEVNSKRKRNKNKFIISESFEAVGTEITDTDNARIKVQLMNKAEKNAFSDSILSPILNAMREYLSEYNNIEVKEEIKAVHRTTKSNTNKLDEILDRLANIEKQLQSSGHKGKSPRKASTLEQLGEDIDDEKSFDEEFELRRVRLDDNRVEIMGGGEEMSIRPTTSVGVKTEKPNRIPARYCWTDANKD